jgi:cupin 2 domain-containing protein
VDLKNLLDDFPEEFDEEYTENLVDCEGVRIERILSRGHSSPPGFWYDQDEDEWVVLLAGAASLSFEDLEDEIVLRPGDHIRIAAHKKHRVEWTAADEETVWLAVFFPSRDPS